MRFGPATAVLVVSSLLSHALAGAPSSTPEPTSGGTSPEPTSGGTSPEPTSGGTSPEPTYGGTSPEPTSGGSFEPTAGGTSFEPTVGASGTLEPTPDTNLSPSDERKIDPGLRGAIEEDGQALVIIALQESYTDVAFEDLFPDLVSDETYISIFEFPGLAAFGGIIVGQDALEVIASSGHVYRVGLDVEVEEDDVGLDFELEGNDVTLTNGGSNFRTNSRNLLGQSVTDVGARDRHALGNDGSGVTVAVLDTGIDTDHPAFPPGTIVQEACFSGGTDCPGNSNEAFGPGAAEDDPQLGHGTHVSGIVASRGSRANRIPRGMAPDANIVAIKVLFLDKNQMNGRISGRGNTLSIIEALTYIANNPQLGVDVVNMSLSSRVRLQNGNFRGWSTACDSFDTVTITFFRAVERLRDQGILTISTAGNNGSDTQINRPACLSNVVAVGNSDRNDDRWQNSNVNSLVNLFAPGTSIRSSNVGGGASRKTGTSMAAPHVAGCAALLLEDGKQTTPEEVLCRLEKSPVDVSAAGLDFPRLDCSPCPNVPPVYPPPAGPSAVSGVWVPPLSTPGVDCNHKQIKIPGHGTYTCMEVGRGICRDNGGNFAEWRFGIDTVDGPDTPRINECLTHQCPLQCPNESTYPAIIDPSTKSYPLIGPYAIASGDGPTPKDEICRVDGEASPVDCRYAGTTHVCIGENTEDDPNKFSDERPYMFFYDEKRHEFLYQLVCDGAGEEGKLPQLKMVNNEDLATKTYVKYPVDIAKFKKGPTADPTDVNELWDIFVDWNGFVDPTRRIGKLAAFTKTNSNFCTEYVEATSTACWEKGANCANVQTSDSNDLKFDC